MRPRSRLTSRKSGFRGTLLLVLAALLTGCVDHTTDPRRAARAFFDHLERGEADAVWSLLTPEDQDRLRAHQKAIADAEGREPSDRPRRILGDYGLRLTGKVDGVTVASRPGDTLEIRVTLEEGESATFRLVRASNGPWRVSLLDALVSVTTSSVPP